jgi:hypothetical protein
MAEDDMDPGSRSRRHFQPEGLSVDQTTGVAEPRRRGSSPSRGSELFRVSGTKPREVSYPNDANDSMM